MMAASALFWIDNTVSDGHSKPISLPNIVSQTIIIVNCFFMQQVFILSVPFHSEPSSQALHHAEGL